jgi:hypothetical protein
LISVPQRCGRWRLRVANKINIGLRYGQFKTQVDSVINLPINPINHPINPP